MSSLSSSEVLSFPGEKSAWIGPFEKNVFEAGGRTVTVVCPDHPLPGLPWAWKGEFLNAFPGTELALLEKGLHIVHMKYENMFGSPEAVSKWNGLYSLLTREYGFAANPALIGLSRGALYCYQWAIANPGQVACIYGDAPVCDMRSWPGGKGTGRGSIDDWHRMMTVFGFESEEEAMAYTGNPIDNLAVLAKHNVPILHVYGEDDEVVPWEENTGIVAERYRRMGGDITLIGKPGCGHHPHGLTDPSPVVAFIMKHTVVNE